MHLDILGLKKVVKTLTLLTFRGEMFMGYSRCGNESNKAALPRQCRKKLSKWGVIKGRNYIFEDYTWLPIIENPKITVSIKYIDFLKSLTKKSINMHNNITWSFPKSSFCSIINSEGEWWGGGNDCILTGIMAESYIKEFYEVWKRSRARKGILNIPRTSNRGNSTLYGSSSRTLEL